MKPGVKLLTLAEPPGHNALPAYGSRLAVLAVLSLRPHLCTHRDEIE